MKVKSDREIIKMFNNVLDDYGFECASITLGENGIERVYNDYTCFEDMRLQIVTNNKGAYVTLFELEKPIFNDRLSVEIMRLYYNDGVAFEMLMEIVISTVDSYLEGDYDE